MSPEGFSTASSGRLKSLVERIERLEADKKAVAGDLSEVFAEAKSEGFDAKIIRKVVKRRATDPNKLQEEEALLELYEAAMGGRSISPPPAPKPADDDQVDLPFSPAPEPAPTPPPAELDTVEAAAAAGAEAAQAGAPITRNPYPAGTPQRLSWDEAWCRANGSDGMEIPAAWKPADPKKPGA